MGKSVHFTQVNPEKNSILPWQTKQKRPFYPSGQTKQKLPKWVNPSKNVYFTQVGEPRENCPFYPIG